VREQGSESESVKEKGKRKGKGRERERDNKSLGDYIYCISRPPGKNEKIRELYVQYCKGKSGIVCS
jgi:hypothetical protein